MTEIQGFIKPTRRPGELGVHSVDRFHFAVPDLAVAKTFYGEFGLDLQEDGDLIAMKNSRQSACLGHDRRGPAQEAWTSFVRRLRGRF